MKAANDHAGILAWRKEKWEPVAKRTHTIHDVFPHPDKPNEYMLHGAVDYNLKNGSTGSASWGGWMVFDDSAAADLKLKKYTVWLVSCARGTQKNRPPNASDPLRSHRPHSSYLGTLLGAYATRIARIDRRHTTMQP